MSLYDYDQARAALGVCDSFAAFIMAAMLRADTDNLARLTRSFPGIHAELDRRYNAPQGLLPGERNAEGWSRTDEALLAPDGRAERKF
jgi:hypothetical protein